MKLSVSNIAWDAGHDDEMYGFLSENGFSGIEIAPSRIFPSLPYDDLVAAERWAFLLRKNFGLEVSSMQSIWYGRNENIFGPPEERMRLVDYTKKAVLFAEAVGCGNMVFGCPRNRDTELPFEEACLAAEDFFSEIVIFAGLHGTAISVEANPAIYHTRFINYTYQAAALVQKIAEKALKVNVDLGTIIQNGEGLACIGGIGEYIGHVHISEPNLLPVERRKLHAELFELLRAIKYDGYVSLEMKDCGNVGRVKNIASYMQKVLRGGK